MSLMLLLLAAAAPAQAGTATIGAAQWTIQKTSDAAKGTSSASASVYSTSHDARLVVRCDVAPNPVLSIQFLPKPGPGESPDKPVTLTFNNGQTIMTNWVFTAKGAYSNDQLQVYSMATAIAGAQTIGVTTSDAAGKPLIAQFDGPGNDALVRQVFDACRMPYVSPSAQAAK